MFSSKSCLDLCLQLRRQEEDSKFVMLLEEMDDTEYMKYVHLQDTTNGVAIPSVTLNQKNCKTCN